MSNKNIVININPEPIIQYYQSVIPPRFLEGYPLSLLFPDIARGCLIDTYTPVWEELGWETYAEICFSNYLTDRLTKHILYDFYSDIERYLSNELKRYLGRKVYPGAQLLHIKGDYYVIKVPTT